MNSSACFSLVILTFAFGLTSASQTRVNFEKFEKFCHNGVRKIRITAVNRLNPDYPTTYLWPHSGETSRSVVVDEKDFVNRSIVCRLNCECGGKAFSEKLIHPDPEIEFQDNKKDGTCYESNDGSIQITTSNQTLRFEWEDGTGDRYRRNLSKGKYIVKAFDSFGCSIAREFEIKEPASFNPSGYVKNQMNVSCFGGFNGECLIQLADGMKTVPHLKFNWSNGGNSPSATALSAGEYWVNITNDSGGCNREKFVITQPVRLKVIQQPVSNYNGFAVSCSGSHDGVFSISVSGGTGPYKARVSNGEVLTIDQHENILQGKLGAGSYPIFVTDNKGCELHDSLRVTGPLPILISKATVTAGGYDIHCNGDSVSVKPVITGGAGNFSTKWSRQDFNGTSTDTIIFRENQRLRAGEYLVEALDQNGCTGKAFVHINEPDPIDIHTRFQINSRWLKIAKLRFTGGYKNKLFVNGQKTNSKLIIRLFSRKNEYEYAVTTGEGCNHSAVFVFNNSVTAAPSKKRKRPSTGCP